MILRCPDCKSVSIIIGDAHPRPFCWGIGCGRDMEPLIDDINIHGATATAIARALGTHDRTETP